MFKSVSKVYKIIKDGSVVFEGNPKLCLQKIEEILTEKGVQKICPAGGCGKKVKV